MPMFDPAPPFGDLLMSLLAAAVGRMTLMLRAVRRATTLRSLLWLLLWEVPITASLGLLGWGLADWLNLQGGAAFVAVSLLGRFGPERLEPVFDTLLPQLRRPPPPPPAA